MLKIEVTGTIAARDAWIEPDGSIMWVIYVEDHTAIDTGSNIGGLYIELPEDMIDANDMSAFDLGCFVGVEVSCMRLIQPDGVPDNATLVLTRLVRFIELD